MNPTDDLGRFPTMELLLEEFERLDASDLTNRGRRLSWRLPALGATALALAVAAAIVVLPSSSGPLATSEASAALHKLALAASAFDESEPLGRGQYYFDQVTSGTHVAERWVSRDAALYVFRPKAGRYERGGSLGGSPGVYAYLPGTSVPLTYEDILEFPRDPEALYDFIRDRIQLSIPGDPRPPENVVMFETISEFVTAYPLPSDLRAAFYETAALIPGVEMFGEVRTADGRTGLGIGRDGNDIVFDPKTGEVLGAGTVSNGEVRRSIRTAVVDELGERR